MSEFKVQEVSFIKSATHPRFYPKSLEDECVFVGRSNVGKSTLLNHLCQRKGMAKTSARPGKTRLINFFRIQNLCTLVDLPGYGYAGVPISLRRGWSSMIEQYFASTNKLKMGLFLFDIRREPREEDFRAWEYLSQYTSSRVLVLTKVDKLNQSQRHRQTKMILASFEKIETYVHYSSIKNLGRRELLALIKKNFLS